MTDYRLYGFSAENRIQDVVEAICFNDGEALEQGTSLTSRFVKVEVWQRARMVGKLVRTSSEAGSRESRSSAFCASRKLG